MKLRMSRVLMAGSLLLVPIVVQAQEPPFRGQQAAATEDAAPAQPRRTDYKQDSEFMRRLEESLPVLAEITPTPPTSIPHDPPPHEGAMIDVELKIGPPDLLRVEVLEALPGRPLSGDFLVRPDGTIDLGFYGSFHVRGLSPTQAKTKLILHMREWIDDEILGLVGFDPLQKFVVVPAETSDRVFVDISAYNSGGYFVLGLVNAPGRLPVTGNETVLHAIQYAGGLESEAGPTKITLNRPARGDSPARNYAIDYEAILEGRSDANLQIFPGDRLIVDRRGQ